MGTGASYSTTLSQTLHSCILFLHVTLFAPYHSGCTFSSGFHPYWLPQSLWGHSVPSTGWHTLGDLFESSLSIHFYLFSLFPLQILVEESHNPGSADHSRKWLPIFSIRILIDLSVFQQQKLGDCSLIKQSCSHKIFQSFIFIYLFII